MGSESLTRRNSCLRATPHLPVMENIRPGPSPCALTGVVGSTPWLTMGVCGHMFSFFSPSEPQPLSTRHLWASQSCSQRSSHGSD